MIDCGMMGTERTGIQATLAFLAKEICLRLIRRYLSVNVQSLIMTEYFRSLYILVFYILGYYLAIANMSLKKLRVHV
jgi:hypothetical protein